MVVGEYEHEKGAGLSENLGDGVLLLIDPEAFDERRQVPISKGHHDIRKLFHRKIPVIMVYDEGRWTVIYSPYILKMVFFYDKAPSINEFAEEYMGSCVHIS